MNLKLHSIVAALALGSLLTPAVQAGPGPQSLPTVKPRPVTTREVTFSCPRCHQPVSIVRDRATRMKTMAATKPAARRVL